jgi:hypothetical protein
MIPAASHLRSDQSPRHLIPRSVRPARFFYLPRAAGTRAHRPIAGRKMGFTPSGTDPDYPYLLTATGHGVEQGKPPAS